MKFKKLYNLWYPHNGFIDDLDTDTLCELISNYINPEIIEVDSTLETYHVFSCINDDDFGATYQRWFNDVIITDAVRNS